MGSEMCIRDSDTQCADNGKKNSVARADLCRPCPVSSCLAAHTRFQRPCFFWCFLRLCCKTPYRTSVLKRIWRITFRSICRIYPSICPSGHNFSVSFVPSRHTFRSKTRSFALLERGFVSISSSPGKIGFRVTTVPLDFFPHTQTGNSGGHVHLSLIHI